MTNSNYPTKRRPYPPKYKQERAKLIRKTQPWRKACGPVSEAGKAASSANAMKHGLRSATVRELKRVLREQAEFLACHKIGW